MLKKGILFILLIFPGTIWGQSAPLKYIRLYKEDAIKKMNEYGVPASIILGVAMHESGSGTSKISKYLNNHFGVKGKSTNRKISSQYKGYDSVAQSYDDFITLLKNHVQFSKLFDKYDSHDYTNWAKGIQKGGYAHSKAWSSQVLAIINKYQLYQFDEPQPPASADPSVFITPPEQAAPIPVTEEPEPVKKSLPRTYKVRRGDNLQLIAKKFGIAVKTIRIKNGLHSATLQIGQHLVL